MDSANEYRNSDAGDVAQRSGSSSFGWNMFLFAIAITMIAVNWGFLRPAAQQLDDMRAQISSLEKTVELLNQERESGDESLNLLAMLKQQGKLSQEAAQGLAEIEDLHQKLIAASTQIDRADRVIQRMTTLQEKVSRHSRLLDDTVAAIEKSNAVQQDLIDSAAASTEAELALSRLSTLRMRLLRSIGYLEEAEPILTEVNRLHQSLLDTESLNQEASDVAEDLISLNKTLVNEGEQVLEAEFALNELIDLRTQLDAQSIDIDKSQDTLQGLVDVKDDVLAQTADIADAIETLERTADLTDQYQEATESFAAMQRWLTDVILMEPTLRRAMNTLEPISELGNLRRISQDELRQAAQVVRDMRRTGIASKPRAADTTAEVATTDDMSHD